jgi:hypothetical protein
LKRKSSRRRTKQTPVPVESNQVLHDFLQALYLFWYRVCEVSRIFYSNHWIRNTLKPSLFWMKSGLYSWVFLWNPIMSSSEKSEGQGPPQPFDRLRAQISTALRLAVFDPLYL